jgi:hypothetical protein
MYKILPNILQSKLTLHADEITEGHQHEFQCNRITTDHVFCIPQTPRGGGGGGGNNWLVQKEFIYFKLFFS